MIGQGRHVHGGAHRLCGSYCGAQSKFQLQDFLQVFKYYFYSNLWPWSYLSSLSYFYYKGNISPHCNFGQSVSTTPHIFLFDLLALIITQLIDPEPDSEILEQTFRLWKNLLLSGIKDHVCGSVTQILSLVLISGWMKSWQQFHAMPF